MARLLVDLINLEFKRYSFAIGMCEWIPNFWRTPRRKVSAGEALTRKKTPPPLVNFPPGGLV